MKTPPFSFRSRSDIGLEEIKVDLWEPMDPDSAAATIASFYLSTWGDPVPAHSWHASPFSNAEAWELAQDAMAGKVLPNTLESIPVTFSITGISRATTHQLVRSRVGAVFGQQGGRDNNWSDFNLRVPETVNEAGFEQKAAELQSLSDGLYKEMVASGVPYQDARYILPMGLETSLVASYNLLSFKSLAARRLCNRMMWETNYVVRLMSDLVSVAFPFVAKNLRSSCERSGTCGSVSPMFPPSCYTINSRGNVIMATDNPTLKEQMEGHKRYEFPNEANGNLLHFSGTDLKRLEKENDNPSLACSLVTGEPILERLSTGRWKVA